jgi:hypothetical protein
MASPPPERPNADNPGRPEDLAGVANKIARTEDTADAFYAACAAVVRL